MLSSNGRPEVWVSPPSVLAGHVHARATTHQRPFGSRTDSRSATTRAREFAAGRLCAARALADAGSREVTVGISRDRAPLWPDGFVGSIAHSATFAWAAVARSADLRSIGIDSEPVFDERALREAGPRVLDASEWRLLRGPREPEHATLGFSAKESLYKCLSPCVGVFFEFSDVELEWIRCDGEAQGAFALCLRCDLAAGFPRGLRFEGRYAIERGHVHTAVELRRGRGER
jgi:enterobactin synthetase component D